MPGSYLPVDRRQALATGQSLPMRTEGVVLLADLTGFTRYAETLVASLGDRRGPEVEAMIDDVEAAILTYPYPNQYRTWPGPNSNTFIAHIGRAVPALGLDLPPIAVGKDYLNNGGVFASTPSGTGVQLSLLGVLGLSIGREEGLEINMLGLTFGIDPLDFALKLPGIGRIGPG